LEDDLWDQSATSSAFLHIYSPSHVTYSWVTKFCLYIHSKKIIIQLKMQTIYSPSWKSGINITLLNPRCVSDVGRCVVVQTKINSMALVHEWTIQTKRPPSVGVVSANFCGYRGVA
jgi:hypothetical protein